MANLQLHAIILLVSYAKKFNENIDVIGYKYPLTRKYC